MIKRIHVNQHHIKHNAKHNDNKPVITVKTSKSNEYGHQVIIHGMAKVIYSPDKPLSCGAKYGLKQKLMLKLDNVLLDT